MHYCEFTPTLPLSRFVERIWTLTGAAAELESASQPILPDGRPELVMHFGDAFERLTPGGQISRQGATIFAGQLTRQLTLRPTGVIAVLGVRFHPFGAASFLDTPQHRLAGLTPGIDEIAPALARALDGVRDETDDVRIAVPLVQTVLEKWAGTREPDQRLQIATRAIVQSGGAISIDRLADRLSVTRRHLERRFLEGIGISPKRLARITRFQRAVRVLEEVDPRRRGAITAATCGYADQSHFIREFRQLAGCSPAEHLLKHGEMTGFFVRS
jgi:AraC-like DNA-binding protein